MKYFIKIIRTKTFSFALAFLIQLAFIFFIMRYLSHLSDVIYNTLTFISVLMCIWVFNRDSDSASKTLWIFLILLFPFFGGVLYLLFAERRIPKQLMIKTRFNEQEHIRYGVKNKDILDTCKDDMLKKMIHMAWNTGYFSVYPNSELQYYPTGEGQYSALIDELQKAKRFIFIETFIINKGLMWDSILSILLEKVREGVDIRLMWDDVGSINYVDSKYAKWLNKQGIKTYMFNPAKYSLAIHQNNRDHRKIIVIDGEVAFTGGQNIADEYINGIRRFGYWKDMGCMIRGKAVEQFTITFLQLWNFQSHSITSAEQFVLPDAFFKHIEKNDGYIIPFSDSPTDENYTGKDFHLNMLQNCQEYFWASTPYLVLDTEMIDALSLAVDNGIDVRIIIPGIPDKKTVYQVTIANVHSLVRKGVKVYIFEPGFLHGKVCIADDTSAVVGTVNMDSRSYYLNYECGIWMYKNKALVDIKQDFENMFEACHEVTLEEVNNTNPVLRILRSFLRITSPLL